MNRKLITLAVAAFGLLPLACSAAVNWQPVQEAGKAYYEAWRGKDEVAAAAALKNYEALAAEATEAERTGKNFPSGFVKASLSTGTGKTLYDATCQACHSSGVMGAPKLGDKAAWAPRIAQGESTLVQHAINGFQGKVGMMPPKGGSSATDAEIKAAVQYMMSSAK